MQIDRWFGMRTTFIAFFGLLAVHAGGCDKSDEAAKPQDDGSKKTEVRSPATEEPAAAAIVPPKRAGPPPALPEDADALAASVSKLVGVDKPNLSLASAESDGQRVRGLACTASSMPLMGSMALLGSISAQKAALDSCAVKGDVAVVRWDVGKEGASNVEVSEAASDTTNRCVREAIAKTTAPFEGSCGVALLIGDASGADEALAYALAPHL